jgi:hypothetical protein
MTVFKFIHSFTGAYSPGWTFGLPFRGFCDYTQAHGRTPLAEWSARRRDLYLHRTTQHINTTDNIHASSRIRTRDPSNQATADLRLRQRGHWDRRQYLKAIIITVNFVGLLFSPFKTCHCRMCARAFVCVCVCVCVSDEEQKFQKSRGSSKERVCKFCVCKFHGKNSWWGWEICFPCGTFWLSTCSLSSEDSCLLRRKPFTVIHNN